ncbi:hypothetical protein NL676_028623 [Syzygium grande]|nr:hypothetical protein NL676_028623 [Syzygium grande]
MVASAVARGWAMRELKMTKTTWTPGRFSSEELLGKWVMSLTPMQRRERWEDQENMRRREAERAAVA